MLGSMYSAVSGLAAHQTKMNVIGNNIANVNTYGYKASRVTFSDVFYQTINGASSPTNSGGGTNPAQLGYGAKVNSVDVINTRAGSATTDRALDVYINGDGYLPVKNSDGVIKYTRVGVLSFDVAGNLVDRNGNQVLGFRLDPTTKNAQLSSDGTTTAQNLVAIKVDPAELDKYTGIAIGQNGEITAIKQGDPAFVPAADTGWMNGTPTVSKTSLYSGPVNMTVSQKFTPDTGSYTGTTPITISSNANLSTNNLYVKFDGSTYTLTNAADNVTLGTAAASSVVSTTTPKTLTFNVADKASGNTAKVTIPLDTVTTSGYVVPSTGALVSLGTVTPASYVINATTTDKSGATVPLTDNWTGAPDDTLALGDMSIKITPADFQAALDKGFTNVNIGTVGPGPGVPEKVAQIAETKFTNVNGLSEDGVGYYVETTNSGKAVATIPGTGGTGTFRAGALEMSNVDLSKEFTEMIITQRGFQANTRMITVSDEMLSDLVSMKR